MEWSVKPIDCYKIKTFCHKWKQPKTSSLNISKILQNHHIYQKAPFNVKPFLRQMDPTCDFKNICSAKNIFKQSKSKHVTNGFHHSLVIIIRHFLLCFILKKNTKIIWPSNYNQCNKGNTATTEMILKALCSACEKAQNTNSH